MKVLHIINSLDTGGAEKLIIDTVPFYNNKGVTTDVLIFKSSNSLFFKQLKEENCCKIIELKEKNVYNPFIIFKLIKYLKKYDIAHVHLFPALYFVAIANYFLINKCKLIFTEHNTTNNRIKNIFLKNIDKIVYHAYDKVVCISTEVKTIFTNHLSKLQNRLVVIENGVDLKKIQKGKIIEINNIENSNKIIIQVSAFRPQKDQVTLIKSLQYLPAHIKLLLVGEGVTKPKCIELVKKLNLVNRVIFLGNRSDVSDLLKTSDIVVLSSKYEGLSISSIEAMACGKPFVASNVPGLKEVVQGVGVLFELGNSKQLSVEILKLLNNKVYNNKIVKNCLENVKKFDIPIMVEKHIKLYNETKS